MPNDKEYTRCICVYFEQRIKNVRKLLRYSKSGDDFGFEALLLTCCLLDALGTIFIRGHGAGQKRFCLLLWEYGTWRGFGFDRVNMVVLKDKILRYARKRENRNLNLSPFLEYVEREIGKHDYGVSTATELDIPYQKVELECGKLFKEKVHLEWLSNSIQTATHAGVLYKRYRCGAVHEARVPGHWDSRGRREAVPFYMPVMGRGIDFTFPELFLVDVVEAVLNRIKKIANP